MRPLDFLEAALVAVHACIYLYMCLAPISSNYYVLWFHIVLCLSLLGHWAMNDNKCILSQAESMLTGKPYTETWLYKLVKPVLQSSGSIAAVTVVLLLVSCSRFVRLHWKRGAAGI